MTILLVVLGEGVAWGQCGTIATFADGLLPTSELHVATNGSNATGDGSLGAPYATIDFAANQATPGTAVVVHAGVYSGGMFIADLTGTAAAPIWIGGAAGESRPVVDGGNTALQVSRARYVVLHDLEFRGSALNGVNFDDGGDVDDVDAARFVVFRDLFIHDIGTTGNQDCLKLSGLDDYVVLDTVIAGCGTGGSGIDHVGCHAGLIARCTLSGPYSSGIQCKGGSADIEIRACRIGAAEQRGVNIGGSTGFEFFRPPLSPTTPNTEASDIRILANVFEGSRSPIAYVGSTDCVVANNTIVQPENWTLRILQETTSTAEFEFLPCGNNRFENNIVYFQRADVSTDVNVGGNTAPGTFTFTSNLWFASDQPANSAPSLPATESSPFIGEDPQFLDAGAGDYRIPEGSPAQGAAGAAVLAAADFDGNCYADPASVGAFEVAGAPAVPACANGLLAVATMTLVGMACGVIRRRDPRRNRYRLLRSPR